MVDVESDTHTDSREKRVDRERECVMVSGWLVNRSAYTLVCLSFFSHVVHTHHRHSLNAM